MIALVLIFLWPAKDLASVQISVRQRITLISMFCLGIIICIAGLFRVWYCSVYLNSWDFLCTYYLANCEAPARVLCSNLDQSPHQRVHCFTLPSNASFLGHGTVLFVIISIETSIGIICGCLPSCKPLFTKLFPSIFTRSTNSNSYSRSRNKAPQQPPNKSVDGQPFPFQIVEEEDFGVRHGDDDDFHRRVTLKKLDSSSRTKTNSNKSLDDDGASGNSREWIMMQKNPASNVSPI
jgi:hypothetical protein